MQELSLPIALNLESNHLLCNAMQQEKKNCQGVINLSK
jgi:hypothetical protein